VPHELGNKNNAFEGKLQALRVVGTHQFDTADFGDSGFASGSGIGRKCEWVDVQDAGPEEDTIRYEVQKAGASIFRRGEGLVYHDGSVYFSCTSGGKAGFGQIFRFEEETQTLYLLCESPGSKVLDYPDNIVISPAPHHNVFSVEDGSQRARIHAITPTGKIVLFGQNIFSRSELCGVTFSPDAKAMFVNFQNDGLLVAITGPFDEWQRGLEGL
jgi:uncharacterized repeat protein (TIGR03803 family)